MNQSNKFFTPFCNLALDLLDCDLHIHTLVTDGKASIWEIIAHAEKIGLKKIAFTEHVRADSEWFVEFSERVREHAQHTTITVLVGAEARIINAKGQLDITEEIRRECDIILASVHRFPDLAGGCLDFSEVPSKEFAQKEFELAMGFIKYGIGDVLAHPGGMSDRFGPGFSSNYLRQLMQEARARDIAIELNSRYILNMQEFCSLAQEVNPLISIGSDVHSLDELGQCRNILKEFI